MGEGRAGKAGEKEFCLLRCHAGNGGETDEVKPSEEHRYRKEHIRHQGFVSRLFRTRVGRIPVQSKFAERLLGRRAVLSKQVGRMQNTEILVVDSDPAHRSCVEDPLLRAGYRVDRITHETAVAHISREDMSRYAAIVVALTDEPSTLSDTYRLGEYVLHYLAQLCPEVLPRVVVVARSAELAGAAAPVGRMLVEPVTDAELLAQICAVIG